MARSADGAWLLLASGNQLLLLDAEGLRVRRSYALASRDGRAVSTLAALRTAALRRSFVLALRDLPELWEISYDPHAEDFYEGLVHDFRMGEGVAQRGFLGVRRIALPQPLRELVLSADQAEALGRGADGAELQVVNLDVRRRVAALPLAEGLRRYGLTLSADGARLQGPAAMR
ncbi:hypothetical protein [Paucibacter soli]|uniref:hypothetical protein n=1 Tax=Paucibacter soli TaxID=3133433 RepID=UPI00309B54E0